ncbi:MAG: hypothetical protein ACYDGM_00355 [Vulcanimicrobiaceae bacterium]
MNLAIALRRRPLEAAVLASLLLHGTAALFVPAVVASSSDRTIKTLAFAPIERIAIETPAKPVHSRASKATVLVPTPARIPRPARTTPRRNVTHRAAQRPSRIRPAIAAPVAEAAVQPAMPAGTGAPQATPTPQPVAKIASVARDAVVGYLPLGAEERDPVLDPGVFKKLAALGVRVTLLVTVGDDGHTKRVVFQPPLDAATEANIIALLATARWDPSVCGGGIPCQGRATIKL